MGVTLSLPTDPNGMVWGWSAPSRVNTVAVGRLLEALPLDMIVRGENRARHLLEETLVAAGVIADAQDDVKVDAVLAEDDLTLAIYCTTHPVPLLGRLIGTDYFGVSAKMNWRGELTDVAVADARIVEQVSVRHTHENGIFLTGTTLSSIVGYSACAGLTPESGDTPLVVGAAGLAGLFVSGAYRLIKSGLPLSLSEHSEAPGWYSGGVAEARKENVEKTRAELGARVPIHELDCFSERSPTVDGKSVNVQFVSSSHASRIQPIYSEGVLTEDGDLQLGALLAAEAAGLSITGIADYRPIARPGFYPILRNPQ